jgi:hypothetical protein
MLLPMRLTAVGASLEQVHGGEEARRPVAFSSHSMNPAERNYPVRESELSRCVLGAIIYMALSSLCAAKQITDRYITS